MNKILSTLLVLGFLFSGNIIAGRQRLTRAQRIAISRERAKKTEREFQERQAADRVAMTHAQAAARAAMERDLQAQSFVGQGTPVAHGAAIATDSVEKYDEPKGISENTRYMAMATSPWKPVASPRARRKFFLSGGSDYPALNPEDDKTVLEMNKGKATVVVLLVGGYAIYRGMNRQIPFKSLSGCGEVGCEEDVQYLEYEEAV
ncbi:hypothetical protein JW872_03555 [Candidatus Babeliales bacterium]|nr:hypothetical protein [Candidatus Babeliales bacterium]